MLKITKSIALSFILELPNEYDDTAVWEWIRHGGKFQDISCTPTPFSGSYVPVTIILIIYTYEFSTTGIVDAVQYRALMSKSAKKEQETYRSLLLYYLKYRNTINFVCVIQSYKLFWMLVFLGRWDSTYMVFSYYKYTIILRA